MAVMTLDELALLVEGRVIGDAHLKITDALPLQSAREGCITLVDHPRHAADLERSHASSAVVPRGFPACARPLIEVDKPHIAFERIILKLRPQYEELRAGVHNSSYVHPTAKIGKRVVIHANSTVGPYCIIGDDTVVHTGVQIMSNCHVGNDCTLFPNVTLYNDSRIGHRVILHASAVIGAYGFGYRMIDGQHVRTSQLGWVEIGDDVEVGAGSTIDRGTYGPTVIGEGTKLDNQVMIGHNCRIGRFNLLCAQVGIAGSSSTGDYVVMGGQVGIKDHIHIGNRAIVAAKSGIMCNIPDGEVWQGSPGMLQKHAMLQVAAERRLPEMRKQLRELEMEVARLRAAMEMMPPKIAEESSSHNQRAA